MLNIRKKCDKYSSKFQKEAFYVVTNLFICTNKNVKYRKINVFQKIL